MKQLITILLVLFYSVFTNAQEVDLTKTSVKQYIVLLQHNKEKRDDVLTIVKEAAPNWIKEDDLPYLMSLLDEEKSSKCVMHIFSSSYPQGGATIAGHAADLITTYRKNKTYPDFLTSCATVNITGIEEIKQWWITLKRD